MQPPVVVQLCFSNGPRLRFTVVCLLKTLLVSAEGYTCHPSPPWRQRVWGFETTEPVALVVHSCSMAQVVASPRRYRCLMLSWKETAPNTAQVRSGVWATIDARCHRMLLCRRRWGIQWRSAGHFLRSDSQELGRVRGWRGSRLGITAAREWHCMAQKCCPRRRRWTSVFVDSRTKRLRCVDGSRTLTGTGCCMEPTGDCSKRRWGWRRCLYPS